jgi:hypothetical protein
MRNNPGIKVPTRSFLIPIVVFTISAIVIFGGAATSQKPSGVSPPKAQEKLPDKEFTRRGAAP